MLLAIEGLTLFLVLPALIYQIRTRAPALAMLWTLAAYCLFILWRKGQLNLVQPHVAGLLQQMPSIAAVFVPFAVFSTLLIRRYARHDLFVFVKRHPRLWALVLLGYPPLSVYPQGIIYRAFFFARYHPLFPQPWLLIAMSAFAFAYMHIIFRNWIAVTLTALGGILFAVRYAQTGSLFISCFEHSLYGCWLFTVGLGRSFLYRKPAE